MTASSASQAPHEYLGSFDEANEAFAVAIREEAERENFTNEEPDLTSNAAMRARCILSEMRRLFEHLGWKFLPQTDRGLCILRLGADLAWLAGPSNPELSVRRWCRRYGQAFGPKLDMIVAATETSNKLWTTDQIATVLGVTADDRAAMGFRQIGACDDPSYEKRAKIKAEKDAERHRRRRAARSTGRKPGRPALKLSQEEKLKRSNSLAAERMRRMRQRRKALRKTPSVFFFYNKLVDAIKRNALVWRRHGVSTGRARKRPAPHVVETFHRIASPPLIRGAVSSAALRREVKPFDPWLHRSRLSSDAIGSIKLKRSRQ
ncbi:hypothetical protein QY049_03905 [Bradyrhizobium sp. WYCCWR 13022]|uniref:hypothetical protein n=1 Tax=unclassified Bradyrhizobium TaxID=2631580 RepID=UPI00263AFD59|nr:hypothetical protein [Bradyrhizobium sp. WYCCWR 13022]MDN4982367.1 hypothetical protein [Bradyrhizobium sp. WYCCWR 13022]